MDLKSKHSYQTQSFLWLLGFSWLLIVCFVGFQYHREKELRTELLDSQLQIINAQLEEALSNARTPHDFFDAHSDFFEGLRITLIDLDGTVVYDSEEPPAEMSNHLDRPEVAGAPPHGPRSATVTAIRSAASRRTTGAPTSTPPPASATGSSARRCPTPCRCRRC